MSDIAYTSANVRPLDGAVTHQVVLGGTIALGEPFYISDKDNQRPVVIRTDGDGTQAVADVMGVLVSLQNGKTTGATGDVGVGAFFGPVAGYSSLTPGAKLYVSDNAGKIATAVGTNGRIVGKALSDTILWVSPQIASAACV